VKWGCLGSDKLPNDESYYHSAIATMILLGVLIGEIDDHHVYRYFHHTELTCL
jgi:hypothetical protein